MQWDYANLSIQASEAGGPERLVESLIESGRREGRVQMTPWLLVSTTVASALTLGVSKLINKYKVDQAKKKALIDSQKAELIQGINDYDSANDSIEH